MSAIQHKVGQFYLINNQVCWQAYVEEHSHYYEYLESKQEQKMKKLH